MTAHRFHQNTVGTWHRKKSLADIALPRALLKGKLHQLRVPESPSTDTPGPQNPGMNLRSSFCGRLKSVQVSGTENLRTHRWFLGGREEGEEIESFSMGEGWTYWRLQGETEIRKAHTRRTASSLKPTFPAAAVVTGEKSHSPLYFTQQRLSPAAHLGEARAWTVKGCSRMCVHQLGQKGSPESYDKAEVWI